MTTPLPNDPEPHLTGAPTARGDAGCAWWWLVLALIALFLLVTWYGWGTWWVRPAPVVPPSPTPVTGVSGAAPPPAGAPPQAATP